MICPKKNDRFINPHIQKIRRSLWDVLLWKTGFYDDAQKNQVPDSFIYPLSFTALDKTQPTVTWINHSTFLVKVGSMHLLTDPIWSDRCSPLSRFGPVRRHPPALRLLELPRIDCVLISHDHYDHLDKQTVLSLHRLFPDIIWLVPEGVKEWFTKLGMTRIIEKHWWESSSFSFHDVKMKATAVPAQHFSGRTISNKNTTLWAGWVVEFEDNSLNKRLYFAGDTGYNQHDFKAIGSKWEKIDLSLIPIGSYLPRKFMAPVHVEPQDAVQIHKDVGSMLSIAMHYKTFHLSDELMHQPPYDLFLALQKEKINPSTFLALDPGYAINW